MTYEELQKMIFRLADSFQKTDEKMKIDQGRDYYLDHAVEKVLENFGTKGS